MQIPDRIEWNQLSYDQQVAIARDLAKQLPPEFEFIDVCTFTMGNITQRVAQFSANEATEFSLIPGGEIPLGFDSSNWQPNPDEAESWADTAEEFEIEDSLWEHINKVTTARRQVSLAPFLIETTASEMGWKSISLDNPKVKNMVVEVAALPKGSQQYKPPMFRGDYQIRVKHSESSVLTAEIAEYLTHGSLIEDLQRQGFRFPTSDEWEYVCGAGTTTLFRWGDHVPCDRYPTDNLSQKTSIAIDQMQDWNYHRQPNAFGVSIAENPYKYEFVADSNTTRGGDGGSTICGGVGFFLGWLTLATAYFEDCMCIINPKRGISINFTIGRRVLPLQET